MLKEDLRFRVPVSALCILSLKSGKQLKIPKASMIIHTMTSYFWKFTSWMGVSWVVPVQTRRFKSSNQVFLLYLRWIYFLSSYTDTSAAAATVSISISVTSTSLSSSTLPTAGTQDEGRHAAWLLLLLLAVFICMLLPMPGWAVRLAAEETLARLVGTLVFPQEWIRRARLAERITEEVVAVPTPWTFPSRK